jgi:UDP-N-acetylmuramyl pentapeptide phosphotransferase/UDP-N-acetylglucosamine-1-phosphate transferase
MNLTLITIFLILSIYFINKLVFKLNHLSNYKGYKHQKFVGFKNVPLSGGFYLLSSCVILFYFSNYNQLLSIFLFLIFIIGFISDINLLSSPKLRLLIQSIIVIFFIVLLDVKVHQTRIYLLDLFLENIYFKYFFSIFCFLILINGSNFIDGLNGLLLGYFIGIILIIFYLNIYSILEIEKNLIISLLIILISLFILNIKNKLFMGDGGAYILGLLFGYFLVKIYEVNPFFSPFFIVHLLWYPCFENLFSILRKFSLKRSPTNADNNHLHQLIFFYFKKKLDFDSFKINNISSLAIISYNLLIFSISLINPGSSKFQIILILFNIVIYLLVYFKLFNFRYKIKF